ncbi:HNH endonuclease [Salinibacterium sp. SWN139]|nr:HNH endonuclease [Salinibacterium sp. SWN139]
MRVLLGALGDEGATTLRIYAWNVTHGGGSARAADEYRIQLTGEMPENVPGETTVVIGWSPQFQTFAGWDASVHGQRSSSSPSLQIREQTLLSANSIGLAAATRHSDDVVVAFRAEMLAVYCLNAEEIHSDTAAEIADLLNGIAGSVGQVIEEAQPQPVGESRNRITRVVTSNFRAWDFSRRISVAYHGRCSVCSIQLSLTEAAHIIPVAYAGSTDLTCNGLSLCRNHHRAYDANLLSVTPEYLVEISRLRGSALRAESRGGGLDELMSFDGSSLAVIPELASDRPRPEFLQIGREARRWVG